MKKSITTFTAAAICGALSLSAFALPAITRASSQKEYEKVSVMETNPEYLEDFSSETGIQQMDWNKHLTVLPSDQIEIMKAEAIKELGIEFNTAIPDNFSFKFNSVNKEQANGSNIVETQLIWSDGTYGNEFYSETSQFILATFETSKGEELLPQLTSLNLKNILTKEFSDLLADTGMNFLTDNLNAAENFDTLTLNSQVILHKEGANKNLVVYLNWINTESNEIYYHVTFENVNLADKTHIITGAENNAAIINQKDVEISADLQAELLEAAKEFLIENNVQFGDLLVRPNGSPASYRINETMYFTFEKNNSSNYSARDFISIYIDSNKNIVGFYY